MRTLKAIIFDMDGVIIDSEPQHGRAALKVLHKYGADADMSIMNSLLAVPLQIWHKKLSQTFLFLYLRKSFWRN